MTFAEKKMSRLAIMFKALAQGLTGFVPTCQQASRLQAETLDRGLPMGQKLGLYLHLSACPWCRRYGKRLRALRKAAQADTPNPLELESGQLSPQARERIKQWLRGRNGQSQ